MRKCRFLELREQEGGWAHYCGVGVSFYLLDEQRHLCRTCPVNALGDAPLCEHLEVYAFLESDAEEQAFVRVRFDCDLLGECLDDLSACASCAHHQVAQDRNPLALKLQGAVAGGAPRHEW